MATSKTVIAAEFQFQSDDAKKRVSELKQELNAAKNQVIALSDEFGASSIQAINAAKSVAKLKNEINDANQLTASFNPEKKFSNLSSAITGVISGFELYQGGLALIGQQSEESEKVIAKLNAIMALKDGYEGVTESIGAFKRLGGQLMQFSIIQKIVTAGQWLWNAAMAANPIGAIVAVVAALIAGIVALTSWFMSNAKAAKAQAAAVDQQTKALEKQSKQLERNNKEFENNQNQQLALAKAQGQSADAIRKLELKLADEKIAFEQSSKVVAENTLNKQKNLLATLKSSGADSELIKKQQENVDAALTLYNKGNENVQNALDEKKAIQNRHDVEIAQEQTNANQKAAQKRQEDNDNSKQKAIERAQANADADKQILSAKQQNTLAMIKDENDRAKIAADFDLENKTNEINALNISNSRKKELIRLAEEENRLVIKGINDKIAEDKKKKDADDLAKSIDAENQRSAILEEIRLNGITDEFTKKQMLLAQQEQQEKDKLTEAFNNKLISDEEYRIGKDNITKIYDAKEIDLAKQNKDEHNKLEEEKLAKKREVEKQKAQAVGNALGAISDLIGKDTAAGKALGIAQALINTYIGASEAIKEKSTLPQPYSTIQKIASVVAILATGFKTVKSIAGVKVPKSGGGGGGASVPSTASIVSPLIAPQAQVTRLDQGQINQIGNAASRAYVVESDVSSGQERINRLNRAARIN